MSYLLFEPDMDLIRYDNCHGLFDLSIPEPKFNERGSLEDYLIWVIIKDQLVEFSYPDLIPHDFKADGRKDNNGDLRNSTGIDGFKMGGFDLQIFPNPTDKDLTIKLPEENDAFIQSIQLMDLSGKVVWQENDLNTTTHLLKNLHPFLGTYILNIDLSDGRKIFEKVIIQ